MDTLKFDLVTPEATFFSGDVSQIDVPGTLGDFGVLPAHVPLISTMRMGIVKIYSGKDGVKRIFVAGGIAEVNGISCAVLAERAVDLDATPRPDAEKALAKAKDVLDKTVDETEKVDAAREVEIAEAIVAALA